MAPTGIKIEGLRELNRALRKIPGGLDLQMKDLHRVSADSVRREALPHVPHVSGRLKRTVRTLASKRRGAVATGRKNVPYAGPIHWGWPARNIRPNPFLVDALERQEKEVELQFLRGVNKIIGQAFKQSGASRFL